MIDLDKVKEDVIKSLIKKAKGYNYNEESIEYAYTEDGEKIQKKKVTTKVVPPDISALKSVIELVKDQNKVYESLTDKELEEEINKLLKQLNKTDNE